MRRGAVVLVYAASARRACGFYLLVSGRVVLWVVLSGPVFLVVQARDAGRGLGVLLGGGFWGGFV